MVDLIALEYKGCLLSLHMDSPILTSREHQTSGHMQQLHYRADINNMTFDNADNGTTLYRIRLCHGMYMLL